MQPHNIFTFPLMLCSSFYFLACEESQPQEYFGYSLLHPAYLSDVWNLQHVFLQLFKLQGALLFPLKDL